MPTPRAWVLDLDGTLADTLPALHAAMNEALVEQGREPVTLPFARASLSEGIDAMLAAAVPASDAGQLSRLLVGFEAHYAARMAQGTQAYSGAETWVRRLVDAAVPLAVCTNRSEKMAHLLLESLGLQQCFDVVVGADTGPWRKPHPAPLLHALDKLGVAPTDAVFVGDSEVDAACAHGAGVTFWLHAGGYGGRGSARSAGRVFTDWGELVR